MLLANSDRTFLTRHNKLSLFHHLKLHATDSNGIQMLTLKILRCFSTLHPIKHGGRSRFTSPKVRVIRSRCEGVANFQHLWRKLSTVPVPEAEDGHSESKVLNQEENRNAERYFRTNPLYSKMVFDAAATTSSLEGKGKVHPAVTNFISCALNEENTKAPVTAEGVNSAAIGDVLTQLLSLTDEELLLVLYYLRNFAFAESVKEEKFMNVWSLLDKECVKRMSMWSLDYMFTVADLWHGVRLSRFSNFHWNVLKKCFRKCDKLTKDQFIRFLFLVNLNRSIPESFATYDLEYYVGTIVNSLTPMEVSIISLAFFKTQTKIKDKSVVEKILDIVSKNASQIESINVAAVAKFARLTSNAGVRSAIMRFQEAFIPEIDRLSIPACTHLALVGTTNTTPNKELISKVVDKVLVNVKEARLKELERISLAMTMFNVECSKLAESIVEELRSPERLEEIRMYGRCLPAILHYLSIIGVLPSDLISIALGEGFRNTYYGRKWSVYQRELLCLDFSAELEIPDYTGNRLNTKARQNLTSMNMLRLSSPDRLRVSEYESIVKRIVKSMENCLGGTEFVYPCNVMPHHHSIEIVYCTDKNGRPVVVPLSYKNIKHVDIKRIPANETSEIVYNALFLCNRSNCTDSGETIGSVNLQIRQLKKMGYQLSVVKPKDVPKTEEIDGYVRSLLSSSLYLAK